MGNKLTIEQMQAIAKSRGGECLSKRYLNIDTKLMWECAKGHKWKAIPYSIKKGSWCPECAGRKNLTLKDMRTLAKSHGGKCLSKRYEGAHSNLEWECVSGHLWKATATSVRNAETWCPKCAQNVRLTIEEMRTIAKSRGGKCLSKKYVNSQTKLEWECVKGHRWKSRPAHVKNRGSWCAECAGLKKLTIKDMQTLAKSHGGKCLSKRYLNINTKLMWECAKGHQWKAIPDTVKNRGSWCAECAGRKKLTIKDMQTLAKSRSGKCLSKTYKGAHSNLEWECVSGHRWKAPANRIKNSGTWCPECNFGVSERICKAYFQQLFGKPFPKGRPKWLTNSRGYQMELDGYCRELKIAFEHQGEQHYTTKTHFIVSDEILMQRKKDDAKKRQLCKKNGIRLISIPALYKRTALENLQGLIYKECKRLRVRRPAGMLDKNINLKSVWSRIQNKEFIQEMQSIARSRGGKCISKFYTTKNAKLEWECAKGHRWRAIPYSVMRGSWCLDCSGSKMLTIEDMQKVAKSRGGKCLSRKYKGGKSKLEWECVKGHRWKSSPANVKNNESWCPECGGSFKLTIKEMRTLAKSRGGKCLSKKYVNAQTKLEWECAKGHRWKAVPGSIKGGTWCPECGGSFKLTIKEMRTLAKSRGGKCLSKKYVNTQTKLEWECAKGHRWKADPAHVKNRGQWCRKCKKK